MSKTLNNLQALRFFSAFIVIWAHIPLSQYSKDGVPVNLFAFGAFGVDIFFVISGFIISYVASGMKGGRYEIAKEFMLRRVLRVVPLYWLFTIIAVYLSYISVNCPHWTSTCPFWLSQHYAIEKTSLDWVVQSLTFTHWFRGPIFDIGWTLIYEFWFYSLFALSLFLGVRALNFFTGLLFLIFFNLYLPEFLGLGIFNVLLNPLMMEFLFGILLYSVISIYNPKRVWITPLVLLAVILLFGYQMPMITENLHDLSRPLFLGGAAFCVVAVALIFEKEGMSCGKTLIKLGDSSYSLYLTHWLVVTTLPELLIVYGLDGVAFLPYIFINLVTSILLSLVVFHFAEAPLRVASKNLIRKTLT